jgi:hypothetical protein
MNVDHSVRVLMIGVLVGRRMLMEVSRLGLALRRAGAVGVQARHGRPVQDERRHCDEPEARAETA